MSITPTEPPESAGPTDSADSAAQADAPALRLYDSAARAIVPLAPTATPGLVTIYLCGATVQGSPHIGHMRSGIAFDVLRRWLERCGQEVRLIRNVTDIDDKILSKSAAAEPPVPWWAWAQRFEREFDAAYRALGVDAPTYEPRATGHIPELIDLVQRLLDAGHAYVGESGNVYYDVRSLPAYGSLTNQRLEDLATTEDESQLDDDVEADKRDPRDFALWKAAKPTEPTDAAWDAPWGRGRPGWHLECSAMSRRYLGETFDIHGGGKDLLFPHHENEIAQTSGATGKPYVRYWMHNGFINIDNEKMSKSKGNFFTVRDISKEFDLEAVRLFMLSAHYRSPINFSRDLIEAAASSLERLYNARDQLQFLLTSAQDRTPDEGERAFMDECLRSEEKFIAAMDDDLNTADALAALFELVRAVYKLPQGGVSREAVQLGMDKMKAICGVLGLLMKEEGAIPAEVRALVDERAEARKNRDWKRSDELRDQIKALGYILEDTKAGQKVRKGGA